MRIESVTINGQPANLAASLTYLPGTGGAEPGGLDGNRGGSFRFDISSTGAVPVALSTGPDNDEVDGGSGIDTVRYGGTRTDYDNSASGAGLTDLFGAGLHYLG